MDVRHADKNVERLEEDVEFTGGYGRPVVKGFRKVMQVIHAADDERVFYAMKSLHFEKLLGDRAHQHSMRINDQFRLIVEFEGKAPNKRIVVVGIEDYH